MCHKRIERQRLSHEFLTDEKNTGCSSLNKLNSIFKISSTSSSGPMILKNKLHYKPVSTTSKRLRKEMYTQCIHNKGFIHTTYEELHSKEKSNKKLGKGNGQLQNPNCNSP